MLIGVVGKPSAGKTTILNALSMQDFKMGDYPFTTIKPNRGVAYVPVECPCATLETDCNPKSGQCIAGIRYIPIEVLDVAGLVPGASEGKGMGNQFLDDLRLADILIHVIDTSGTTDAEGNNVEEYDPSNDIQWLNDELDAWVSKILYSGWDRLTKKIEADRTKLVEILNDKLSGLGSSPLKVKRAIMKVGLMDVIPRNWSDEQMSGLAKTIRENMFPMIIAANKIDRSNAVINEERIKAKYPELIIVGTSGLAELTLRKFDEAGILKYRPGDSDFVMLKEDSKQASVANTIKEKLLSVRGSTGITQLLSLAVFDCLQLVPVFPVEDTTHYTDKDGRILPDAYLVSKGTTAKEFAGKIHSDLAEKFIHGILANKNNKRIAASYEVEHGDVIKIVSAVK